MEDKMGLFKKLKKDRNTIDAIDLSKLPVHVAIIPDGNGRWAKKRGLPRTVGHRYGSENMRKIVEFCSELGIKYLTFYVFSTENWSRPKEEVDALMDLLLEYLGNAEKELAGSNIRIRVIGNINGLPEKFHEEIPRVERMTAGNTGLNLIMAINYGGRDEILSAVKSIAKDCRDGSISIDDINQNIFSQRLYTGDIPDPDLVIRTSGEQRSSNFLLWQSAYSEYCFLDVLWPDFSKENMIYAIGEYQKRNRRFGGI